MAQCNGSCASCGGCAKTLLLSDGEIHILRTLGQIPFLPVARRADDMTPMYLEQDTYAKEEYSLILQVLEKKALIDIDYSTPLKGVDMSAYKGFPVHGSFALTARGQQVVDALEIHGIPEN